MSKNSETVTRVMHACVKQAPSGLTAKTIAELVRANYQTLMSELSGQVGHKLGADMLVPLMRAAGTILPLVSMARAMGCVVVPLPDPEVSDEALMAGVLTAVREFGDFVAEAAEDVRDGKIPDYQLDRIQKEGGEAIAAITAFIRLAEQVNQQQRGK